MAFPDGLRRVARLSNLRVCILNSQGTQRMATACRAFPVSLLTGRRSLPYVRTATSSQVLVPSSYWIAPDITLFISFLVYLCFCLLMLSCQVFLSCIIFAFYFILFYFVLSFLFFPAALYCSLMFFSVFKNKICSFLVIRIYFFLHSIPTFMVPMFLILCYVLCNRSISRPRSINLSVSGHIWKLPDVTSSYRRQAFPVVT